MAFTVKPITNIKCPYDGCYYSITFASEGTDQAVVDIICFHYREHIAQEIEASIEFIYDKTTAPGQTIMSALVSAASIARGNNG